MAYSIIGSGGVHTDRHQQCKPRRQRNESIPKPLKETPRSRITVMSSLQEISTLRISWEIGWWRLGRGVTLPFLQQASGQIFKDDVNGFSSTSDICFTTVHRRYCILNIRTKTLSYNRKTLLHLLETNFQWIKKKDSFVLKGWNYVHLCKS